LKKNQPGHVSLPGLDMFKNRESDVINRYADVFNKVGGKAYLVDDIREVKAILAKEFDLNKRVVTSLSDFADLAELISPDKDPHSFQDVELAIIKSNLSVAENGAVWLTDDLMVIRIIPYICQHLAVILNDKEIVSTMHDAYDKIGEKEYGFGCFIGGPSKTADIEQALVLGAHGPLSMIVFILRSAA
jgi:L-lactate dehydrogenase complex protein LldG